MNKDEKVKGVKLQIERNLDNLQLLMHDHDEQIYDLMKRVYGIIAEKGTDEQVEAAYFLVEQMPLLQEERREILMENEQFHLSNQEMINEIERLKSVIDRLRVLFGEEIDLEEAPDKVIFDCLKRRLDSLHERLEEEKKGERVSDVTELRMRLEVLERESHREGERRELLQGQLDE